MMSDDGAVAPPLPQWFVEAQRAEGERLERWEKHLRQHAEAIDALEKADENRAARSRRDYLAEKILLSLIGAPTQNVRTILDSNPKYGNDLGVAAFHMADEFIAESDRHRG